MHLLSLAEVVQHLSGLLSVELAQIVQHAADDLVGFVADLLGVRRTLRPVSQHGGAGEGKHVVRGKVVPREAAIWHGRQLDVVSHD